MRWPFRRAAADDAGAAVPGVAGPAAGDAAGDAAGSPAVSDAGADRGPGWAALPPIASTWHADERRAVRSAARSPLTVPPTTVRPALTQEPTRRSPAADDALAPAPGRVTGLATARPPTPVLPALPPHQFPDQPPLRHVSARPVVQHAPLTRATDDYVSEPIAPAPPPPPAAPAPSFFPAQTAPRAEPPVEAMTDAGARFREALANLHRSGLPEYHSDGSGDTPAPPAPAPKAGESWTRPEPAGGTPGPPAPTPPVADPGPALTHRRNTLAQSRRLGLGAPIRRDEHGTATDAGDAPADAEPARGAAGPALRHPPAASTPVVTAPVVTTPDAFDPTPRPGPAPAPPVSQHVPSHELAAQHADNAPPAPLDDPEHAGDAARDDAGDEHVGRSPLEPVTVAPHAITDGTARPAAVAAALVYRARATDSVDRMVVRQEIERAVVTRAPAELSAALRSTHGIDVADVPVRRDTDAGSEAGKRRARAFTRGGTVYLPEAAGTLDTPQARGLLAHELVHAAQQRRLGGTLPGAHTPEGRALEDEAVAAERMYSSTPSTRFDEPALVHAPAPVSAGWVDERIVQLAGDPVDYLDSSAQLTATMRSDFREAADEAVSQVVESFGGTYPADVSAGDAAGAEQNFLDVINAELDKRGEPPQATLSATDSEKVQKMLKKGPSQSQVDVVRSSQASRWQQETFGNSMALGGDFAGIAGWFGWGKQDGVDVIDNSKGTVTHVPLPGQPGQPGEVGQAGDAAGGHHAGGAPSFLGTMFGTSPHGAAGAAGTPGARHAAAGAGATTGGVSLSQQRPAGTTLAGFAATMFGAEAVFGGAGAPGAPPGAVDPVTGRPSVGSAAQRGHVAAPGGIDAATGLPKDHQYGEPLDLADTDEENLDDLVTRIYDRLRSRLRRDLIVDRERAGLLTDFR